MRRVLPAMLALLLLLAALPLARAHKPSDSYLVLQAGATQIEGQWDIALRDLEYALGLDANGDGAITWGELKQKHRDIEAYALSRLALSADGKPCTLRATGHLVDEHTDGAYEVLRFAAACPANSGELSVRYSLFFDIDPQHKGLLRLVRDGDTGTAIFSPDKAQQSFPLRGRSGWRQLLDYGGEGVWHIWIGFDHILFLLALLLPAVLQRRGGRWEPVPAFWPALVDVARIVTAFTVAHSITLSLATLQLLTLPSRLVESVIALSVVLAALNNVFPLFAERRWIMAFAFGLIHGFGFASVLADLGLPAGTLALALLGFNLGVEAGQLAIVAVFLPLAWALRHTLFYRRGILVGGSLLVTAIALAWLLERALDLKLLPS